MGIGPGYYDGRRGYTTGDRDESHIRLGSGSELWLRETRSDRPVAATKVLDLASAEDIADKPYRADTPLQVHFGRSALMLFSLRGHRSDPSVRRQVCRSCNTRSSSLPTRIIFRPQ
jgi:hypothetical protein